MLKCAKSSIPFLQNTNSHFNIWGFGDNICTFSQYFSQEN